MINGVAVRGDHTDPRVGGIRPARLNVAWPRFGLVEIVETGVDVRAFGGYPAGLENIIICELLRDLEIEVLYISVVALAIHWNGDNVEDRIVGIQRRRYRILNRRHWIHGGVDHRETAAAGRV